ncbi:MAG: DUF4974 domain-containing protein [Chitinophagaceae bacterium]
MNLSRIEYLLQQFANNKLTPGEQQELETLLSGPERKQLEEMLSEMMAAQGSSEHVRNEAVHEASFRKIMSADQVAPVVKKEISFMRWRRLVAAAVVIACLLTGAYYIIKHGHQQNVPVAVSSQKPGKEPGSNKATLTLEDNSIVELNKSEDSVLGTQGHSKVMMANGQLAYQPQQNADVAAITYNKITTPRGGEFAVTLSDGTKVWLNAASMLRFPTAFTGPEREVELDGEAYFEVAKDKEHPFIVKIRDRSVQVFGTEFNIMGYNDEASIVTTLVNGSVQVSSPDRPLRMLVPGEHAVINNQTANILVEGADVDAETAWRNGRIYFNNADLRLIMRQVSRWYNVDIQYKNNVENLSFNCAVSRWDNLSKLLRLLEMTGVVRFTMEGNTIIVQS